MQGDGKVLEVLEVGLRGAKSSLLSNERFQLRPEPQGAVPEEARGKPGIQEFMRNQYPKIVEIMANPERGLRDIVGQVADSCCWIEIRQFLREQPPRSNHVSGSILPE